MFIKIYTNVNNKMDNDTDNHKIIIATLNEKIDELDKIIDNANTEQTKLKDQLDKTKLNKVIKEHNKIYEKLKEKYNKTKMSNYFDIIHSLCYKKNNENCVWICVDKNNKNNMAALMLNNGTYDYVILNKTEHHGFISTISYSNTETNKIDIRILDILESYKYPWFVDTIDIGDTSYKLEKSSKCPDVDNLLIIKNHPFLVINNSMFDISKCDICESSNTNTIYHILGDFTYKNKTIKFEKSPCLCKKCFDDKHYI